MEKEVAEAVLNDLQLGHTISLRSLKALREEAVKYRVGSSNRDDIEYWIPAAQQNVNDLADKMDAALSALGLDLKVARA